ncbi:hypothetical protein [Domibacillus iocasae]|uniref:DUF1292 domain-containing protein n=1 Tax=Domibacillus iocasae TaxID=1714016 RepID=A0A1E7DJZ2_9BACI|nr:hypothetical protein [Domibacillus iocasae]OES43359.1 hypothetical protein BA724_14005 [Domibacillus iocasae]
MSTFKNLSYGLIKEVGEDDVLINLNGEDFEVKLTPENRQPIFDSVEAGNYLVPVDSETKELLMTVDTQTFYEVFPESELAELEGAADYEPNESEEK